MKKFLSILLALTMVFSMGAIAFAEDTTAEDTTAAAEDTTVAPEETPVIEVKDILDMITKLLGAVNWDTIKDVVAQSKVTIDNLAAVIGQLFGSEDGKPVFSVSEFPAQIMNAFLDGLAKLFKTDRQTIIDKLLEIPFVKTIMGWYGYKPATPTEAPTEAPETTTEASVADPVPETGAAAAVAAFASLSVAAAAAFVSKKKAA